MKKQLVIIGILALLFIVGLSGCEQNSNTSNPDENKFVGTWQNTTRNITRTISLSSDGSCSFSNFTGTWYLQNGIFIMNFPDSYLTYRFNYLFSNNNRTLSLSSAVGSSITQVFTKQ
ncbi:Uncharacterised protein [uncultured archaeon]|nr:Uncharacterised protein [uncultured archaeon]